MTQENLPFRQALHRRIVEQAPDAVIVVDVDGRIQLWNERAAAIFGYPESEVKGRDLNVIVPESLREAHWRGFRQAIETGATKYAGKAITTRSDHKDGRKLYVDLSFALLKDDDGAVLGSIAIARDSTESYLGNRATKARVATLEQALRSAEEALSRAEECHGPR